MILFVEPLITYKELFTYQSTTYTRLFFGFIAILRGYFGRAILDTTKLEMELFTVVTPVLKEVPATVTDCVMTLVETCTAETVVMEVVVVRFGVGAWEFLAPIK